MWQLIQYQSWQVVATVTKYWNNHASKWCFFRIHISKIGSILWWFQCVVHFYPVNMWFRQPCRDNLFDPSSGFYKRSQIASFQLPKTFIAVFRSSSIVDSLYYSHCIRIHVPKCGFLLWSKAFFLHANNCPSLKFCKILKVSPNSKV
jgi:hypothetical protein